MSAEVIHGALEYVALGLEDERGEQQDWDVVIPLEDAPDIDPAITYENRQAPTSNIFSVQTQDIVAKGSEPSFTTMIYPDLTGYLLTMITGQKPSTTEVDASGVYEHEFTAKQSARYQTATLHNFLSDDKDAYTNTVMSEWTLNIDTESATQEVSMLGRSAEDSTSDKPERSDFNYDDIEKYRILGKHFRIKIADTADDLDDADDAEFETSTAGINTNADFFRVNANDDATQPYDVLVGRTEFELEMTVLYDREKFFDKYKEGDTVAVRITGENTDETLADNTTHPKIEIEYPKVYINEYSKDNSLEEKVMLDIGLSPVPDGEDDPYKITLVNAVEEY